MKSTQLKRLRSVCEKATQGQWVVHWYKCLADKDDVAAKMATKVGQVLWKVPEAIGPISPATNHWEGDHLCVPEDDVVFLTTLTPETVLRLLDYVDYLRGKS